MARVITGPGAIFRQVSEFQAPKIRQTGMDRTKEAWASPKGIETGVGLGEEQAGRCHPWIRKVSGCREATPYDGSGGSDGG